MKKQRGWQTGERVPSVLWRLRLAAGWSVALLDPNLSQISLRRRSTAAHLLVRRSVAMYCNRSWVLLALLRSASHCCTLLHSTSLRRFVCKECPSASPFNIVPPKPSPGDMYPLQCVYVDSLLWAYLDKSVTLYQEEGKNGRLGKTNDLIKHWATTALPLVAMPKGEI